MRSPTGLVGIIGALALSGLGAACDDGETTTDSVSTEPVSTEPVSTESPIVTTDTANTSTVPAASARTTPATTTRPTELTPTTTTTSTTTTTAVEAAMVFRPYVADPEVCVSAAAREANVSEYSDGLLRPFALSSSGWHRFQIVADQELGTDGRWALVGTIPASTSLDPDRWHAAESEDRHLDTINGWPVAITTTPSGYAGAAIDLGGETDAYVRTYRFELDSIRALISGLAVRSADEPIGFDYSPVADLEGLEVVIDRGDEPVGADVAVLECVAEDESIVRIAAITGDPLVQYVTILDQPFPDEIGRIGDAVVSISGLGRGFDDGPQLSNVTHAPADVWSRLLEQRPPSEGPVDNNG